jgi:hypothetical protein
MSSDGEKSAVEQEFCKFPPMARGYKILKHSYFWLICKLFTLKTGLISKKWLRFRLKGCYFHLAK